MRQYGLYIAAVVALCALSMPAFSASTTTPWDFRPVVIDGDFTEARTAHQIAEPDKGHIGYHHARPEAPALWFRFDGDYGDRITLRLGVPALDRYRLLRPAIAVLGQGLPPIEDMVPFEIPEGYGGKVYHAADLDVARHEENYSGAISWRFETIEHTLNASGRIYLVGFIPIPDDPDANYDPEALDGKFWMSVGHRVNFQLRDLARTYRRTAAIRAFFEDAVTQSNLYRTGIMALLIALIAMMIAVA